MHDYDLEEVSISPFELQKADEMFVTNVVGGIQSITKYRKKEYTNAIAKELLGKLNTKARLG
jgi:branched-chain amino acid aminotransferase